MNDMILFAEEKKDITSSWDKTVPIIAKGKIITAYLTGEIYEQEHYNELCYTLENTEAEQVRLVINNDGGLLDTMLDIVASIKACNCEVVGVLRSSVASAATMIALVCDRLEVADHTRWLTHYYSGGIGGKGNEIKAKYDFEAVEIPKIFKELHTGFLTTKEIDNVIKGQDMWFNKEQILERFARKVK